MLELNPLNHPICFTVPERITPYSAWHEHIPFAMFLVELLRPKMIVELGTQYGDSYCAFCQAVKELKLDTCCYAIDTWRGDPHASFYGPEVLADLRTHHDPLYGSFSRLIQSTFDEALQHFADGTIDIMHIDGYHTYESVKHDFESWLPKMSACGVMLFHDINVREGDFGIRKFWDEIKEQYPHFEFLHCHGLGVLGIGEVSSKELQALLQVTGKDAATIRNFFFQLGHQLNMKVADEAKDSELENQKGQLAEKNSQIDELSSALQAKDFQLQQMQRGIVMQLLNKYQRAVEKVLCSGTRRRYYYELGLIGIRVILNEGWRSFWFRAKGRLKQKIVFWRTDPYQLWIAQNEPKAEELDLYRQESLSFQYRPKISIITPVWNTDKKWLRAAIDSVIGQVYDNWELCLADGGSTKRNVSKVLQEYAQKDSRIKVKLLPENKGIAGNSNEALSLATGEFVGFLDHDDELAPFALYEVVKLLNEKPEADLIYSDEDKITTKEKRADPFFKPDWSPDMFLSCMYTCHFGIYRKKIIDEISGFRLGYDGSQDYDLVLRFIEKTNRTYHIPKVLYHWRTVLSSAASGPNVKPFAFVAAKKAISDYLVRNNIEGEVADGAWLGSYRVKRKIIGKPMVSIIIPSRDNNKLLKSCVDSILTRTEYVNYEILIVDNLSVESGTFDYYDNIKKYPRITILQYNKPFNFSALNNYAVSQAQGEHILLLNDVTEVISAEWLSSMLEHSQRKEVGAVGAKLLFPNGTIQHCGIIMGLGVDRVAGHAYYRCPDHCGYIGRISNIENYSAVTAACMMLRKEVFNEVGGFDEKLTVAYNDIDLCLRIRDKGYLIVYTPYAVLYHYESASRPSREFFDPHPHDTNYFKNKWRETIEMGDPYYNTNLSLDRLDFHIRLEGG